MFLDHSFTLTTNVKDSTYPKEIELITQKHNNQLQRHQHRWDHPHRTYTTVVYKKLYAYRSAIVRTTHAPLRSRSLFIHVVCPRSRIVSVTGVYKTALAAELPQEAGTEEEGRRGGGDESNKMRPDQG